MYNSEHHESLKQWASDSQRPLIDAVIVNGGSVRAAAHSLGVHHSKIQRVIGKVEAEAARLGHAPGHWQDGVAAGYWMGKVTVHRKNGVVEQTWERQLPDERLREAAIKEAFDAMASELPKLSAIPAPPADYFNKELANVFTITDYHMGMLAWAPEAGEDWDLKIAEDTLWNGFKLMLELAPSAHTAVINQLGDFLHFDGLKAITPEHGNLLDADTRFPKLVTAVIRVLRRLIDAALKTHKEVHVKLAEGNHDMVSSIWLRAMFGQLYENEPRVTIDESSLPYYIFPWGKNLLGFHHGHLSKNEALPLLFASQFRKEWGRADYTYIHTGHRHHKVDKDFGGARVIQHPTLSARDAYAARGGWVNERAAITFTYHKEFGEVCSFPVTPKMIGWPVND